MISEPENRKHGVGYWCCWAALALVLYVAAYILCVSNDPLLSGWIWGKAGGNPFFCRPHYSHRDDLHKILEPLFRPLYLIDRMVVRPSYWHVPGSHFDAIYKELGWSDWWEFHGKINMDYHDELPYPERQEQAAGLPTRRSRP